MSDRVEFDIKKIEMLSDIEIEEIKYRLYMQNNGIKRILVASVAEKEGKTSVLLKLAASIAKDGKNILVILPENTELVETFIPNEKIVKTNMQGIDLYQGNELEPQVTGYDYVMREAPALEKSSVGIRFADNAELILFVVQANCVSRNVIRKNISKMKIGKCKNIQVILNRHQKDYGILKARG